MERWQEPGPGEGISSEMGSLHFYIVQSEPYRASLAGFCEGKSANIAGFLSTYLR